MNKIEELKLKKQSLVEQNAELEQDQNNIQALVKMVSKMVQHNNPNMSKENVKNRAHQMIENV